MPGSALRSSSSTRKSCASAPTPTPCPISNEKQEGYEQKLAELFAEKLGKTVSYTYFPQVTGFVRLTLGAYKCDVIMSYPQSDELVQNTNAYYQTAYALVSKPGSDLDGRGIAVRSAPEGQAYRHRGRHAAGDLSWRATA